MSITNHVLGGALIALTIKEPVLVLPLAYVSHFAFDALPHFGFNNKGYGEALKHKTLIIIEETINLGLLAVVLFMLRGHGWLVYAAALIAVSPDAMWPPRYLLYERKGLEPPPAGPITRFHQRIQWFEKPIGVISEAIFCGILLVLLNRLI